MIQALSVEGSRLDTEPSAIWGINVEGSALNPEPSTIWGISVEGSVLENGTVRDIESPRGRLVLFTSNCP